MGHKWSFGTLGEFVLNTNQHPATRADISQAGEGSLVLEEPAACLGSAHFTMCACGICMAGCSLQLEALSAQLALWHSWGPMAGPGHSLPRLMTHVSGLGDLSLGEAHFHHSQKPGPATKVPDLPV